MSLVTLGGATRLGAIQRRLSAVTVDEARIGTMAARLLDTMRVGQRQNESDERIEIALGFHRGQILRQL